MRFLPFSTHPFCTCLTQGAFELWPWGDLVLWGVGLGVQLNLSFYT